MFVRVIIYYASMPHYIKSIESGFVALKKLKIIFYAFIHQKPLKYAPIMLF